MKRKPNLDDLFAHACAIVAHKPDMSKGKTPGELRLEWGIGEQAARRRVRQFVEAGLMEDDKDWRPFEGNMRRAIVYRWTAKAKGAKR